MLPSEEFFGWLTAIVMHSTKVNSVIDQDTAGSGAALLRVTMGTLFLAHVWIRIMLYGLPQAEQWFETALGFPGFVAFVVTAAEAVGGVALLLGVATRLISLALVPLMLGTIIFVHGSLGFLFSSPNGGWEYPAFWTAALIAQALIGPGRYALWSPAFETRLVRKGFMFGT